MVMMLICIPWVPITDACTLGIYGNANEDETIDRRDISCIERIISGKSPGTKLADANRDGRIDLLDIRQTEAIIAGSEKVLSLIDSAGKTITVKKPVNRIVSISLYCSEPIRMLGEMEKIIAVQSNAKKSAVYFPKISRLPSIGGYPPDFEEILKFQPDLLIGATSWTKHLYGIIPDAIVPVVGLSFTFPDIFVEEMIKLGYILNKRNTADHYLCSFYNRYLRMIKTRADKIPEQDKPKVYMEYSMGDYRAYGGARKDIEMAGGKNIFSDFPAYFEVDPEEVMERNPDIIIKQLRYDLGYMGNDASIIKQKRDEILNRPALANTTAVRNGNVYILAEKIAYGCTYPVGVAYMGKVLHPKFFKDLDPQAMHQEFIDNFCPGIDFNVSTQGIFLYPPIKLSHGDPGHDE